MGTGSGSGSASPPGRTVPVNRMITDPAGKGIRALDHGTGRRVAHSYAGGGDCDGGKGVRVGAGEGKGGHTAASRIPLLPLPATFKEESDLPHFLQARMSVVNCSVQ